MKWCALVLGARWQNRRRWAHFPPIGMPKLPWLTEQLSLRMTWTLAENILHKQRYKKEAQWGGVGGEKCSGVSTHIPSTVTHKHEESQGLPQGTEARAPRQGFQNWVLRKMSPQDASFKTSSSVVQESWGLWETKTLLLKVVHKSHTLESQPRQQIERHRPTYWSWEQTQGSKRQLETPRGTDTAAAISRTSIYSVARWVRPHQTAFPQTTRGLLRQPIWEATPFPYSGMFKSLFPVAI